MFLITIYMPFAPNKINSITNCETLLNTSTTIAIFCFLLMVVWFFFGLCGSIFFHFSVRHSNIWKRISRSDKISIVQVIILLGAFSPLAISKPEKFIIEFLKFYP